MSLFNKTPAHQTRSVSKKHWISVIQPLHDTTIQNAAAGNNPILGKLAPQLVACRCISGLQTRGAKHYAAESRRGQRRWICELASDPKHGLKSCLRKTCSGKHLLLKAASSLQLQKFRRSFAVRPRFTCCRLFQKPNGLVHGRFCQGHKVTNGLVRQSSQARG